MQALPKGEGFMQNTPPVTHGEELCQT